MNSETLLERAEECRLAAGQLAAISIVSFLSGIAVWFSLGPGDVLLACVTVVLVTALGAINESHDARQLQRRAENARD